MARSSSRAPSSPSSRPLRFAGLILVLAAAPAAFGQASYQIDTAHSGAQFAIRHMMVSTVRGAFSGLKGAIVFDAANLAGSKVEATLDVTSINTQEPKRDAHLKSPDFFDAAKFPTLTFASKEFFRQGSQLKVRGDLSMHGVTKEVVFDVEGPSPEAKGMRGEIRIGATVTGTINRKDWGLNWGRALETGGVVVGDEVKITIDIEAIRK